MAFSFARRACAAAALSCAALSAAPFPESADVRARFASWFSSPPEAVRGLPPAEAEAASGEVFQVRQAERGGALIVSVLPRERVRLDMYTQEGMFSQQAWAFGDAAPGAWRFARESGSGRPLYAEVVLAHEGDVSVRFTPRGDGCTADMLVCGSYAARGVAVPVAFPRLYEARLADLKAWAPRLPWQFAAVSPALYRNCAFMAGVVRQFLRKMTVTPGACYGEDGESVSWLTGEAREEADAEALELDGAGFVKWVVDGLVRARTGRNTAPAALLAKTSAPGAGSRQEALGARYNMSFALDWTRNLASAAVAAEPGRVMAGFHIGVDVISEPLALAPETAFVKDTGYPARGLRAVLYALAALEPDVFYLAAVRETDREAAPETPFFSRAAVVFPYFDETGRFAAAVFEAGEEMALAEFTERCRDAHIYLTRVTASSEFDPQRPGGRP